MNKSVKKINKSTFKPIKSLEDRHNYKRLFRIEKNGSIKERVILNVPDIFLREEIILNHYLSFLVRNFIQSLVGVNIISRDDPWDFSVELSNGLSFNVEITSVADNKWSYKKMKREEEYEKMIVKKKIRLRELKKIYLWFGDKKLKLAIKEFEKKIGIDEFVKNPFFGKGTNVYISDSKDEEESLLTLILEAIEKKNNKNHKGKEETILIIDNRTSIFEIKDYQKTSKELEDKLTNTFFPEIYFYIGYCSDNDGSNAEYSFSPIKLPEEKYKKLEKKIKQGELKMDENNISYS